MFSKSHFLFLILTTNIIICAADLKSNRIESTNDDDEDSSYAIGNPGQKVENVIMSGFDDDDDDDLERKGNSAESTTGVDEDSRDLQTKTESVEMSGVNDDDDDLERKSNSTESTTGVDEDSYNANGDLGKTTGSVKMSGIDDNADKKYIEDLKKIDNIVKLRKKIGKLPEDWTHEEREVARDLAWSLHRKDMIKVLKVNPDDELLIYLVRINQRRSSWSDEQEDHIEGLQEKMKSLGKPSGIEIFNKTDADNNRLKYLRNISNLVELRNTIGKYPEDWTPAERELVIERAWSNRMMRMKQLLDKNPGNELLRYLVILNKRGREYTPKEVGHIRELRKKMDSVGISGIDDDADKKYIEDLKIIDNIVELRKRIGKDTEDWTPAEREVVSDLAWSNRRIALKERLKKDPDNELLKYLVKLNKRYMEWTEKEEAHVEELRKKMDSSRKNNLNGTSRSGVFNDTNKSGDTVRGTESGSSGNGIGENNKTGGGTIDATKAASIGISTLKRKDGRVVVVVVGGTNNVAGRKKESMPENKKGGENKVNKGITEQESRSSWKHNKGGNKKGGSSMSIIWPKVKNKQDKSIWHGAKRWYKHGLNGRGWNRRHKNKKEPEPKKGQKWTTINRKITATE